MFRSRSKIIAVSLGIMIFFSGILVGMSINLVSSQVGTQHARRTLRVTIDPDQWPMLFDQFRKFADKWRYAIRIAPLDPNNTSFDIQMWRADMRFTAFMDGSFDEGRVQIHFYDTDRTRLVPEWHYDEEVNDLMNFLREIPNVRIVEEK